jgi:pyruvate,water dikinase
LIKLLTRVPPSARRRIKVAAQAIERRATMREVERWEQLRPTWIDKNLALQDVDLAACSDAQLADQVRAAVAHATEGVTLHFELVGQALAVGEYLLRLDDWGIDRELGSKAAFHGVPSPIESRGRVAAIVAAIGDAAITTLDDVRSQSSEAAAALDDFLRHHGSRVLADDIDAATLTELPDAVVRMIERARAHPGDEAVAIAAALAACREAVPAPDSDEFDRLVGDAQRAHAALDDNSGITASWPMGLLRRTHVEAARRLVERGTLPTEEGIWALDATEIAGLLADPSSMTAAAIEQRIARRAAQAAMTPPAHLGAPPSPPPDPSLFPAPAAKNTREVLAFINAKFGTEQAAAIGVGDATATGRAAVARSADEAIARVEPGDVLVTNYTTPAYNAVMSLLAGIVTIAGGPNSHTAIVAREFGIPAVIGLADALDTIPDGTTVEVDLVAATVAVIG